jgi:hypothetical protein
VHCTNYVILINLAKKESKEMKVAGRLAILVAALLLVTNMAFANGCDQAVCYNIIATYENGDTNTDYWEVCLYNDGTGSL